jgi:hypothetical protein
MTIAPDDVLAVLRTGRGAGMTIEELVQRIWVRQLGDGRVKGTVSASATQRKVRDAVEQARREGKPICATPAHGYYLAETEAELSETIAFLRSRAMTSLTQIARLRRVSLPVLMGQLQIELAAEKAGAEPSPPCARQASSTPGSAEWSESMCRRCDGGPCAHVQAEALA